VRENLAKEGAGMVRQIYLWAGIASILSALLYRAGGQGKPFNTKYRDIGCSVVTLALCLALGLVSGLVASIIAYLLTFGLSWAALASYWGLDEQKWGFWAHGLGLSLAMLPIAFITGHWIGLAIRTIVLTVLITLWSEFIKIDTIEEMGRGAILALTIPILTLPI